MTAKQGRTTEIEHHITALADVTLKHWWVHNKLHTPIGLQEATQKYCWLYDTMAQPPTFNKNSRFGSSSETSIGRGELADRDRRIGVLQREVDGLKRELERYRVKMNMLRKQPYNMLFKCVDDVIIYCVVNVSIIIVMWVLTTLVHFVSLCF